jgi:hypothetical protein
VIKGFWGVLFLSLLCISCSDQVAGGTEAESTIALEVISPSGTLASYARARFLPSSYLSNGEPSSEWVKADHEGKIEYKTLDTGAFTIEVRYLEESESFGAIKTMSVVPGKKVFIDSLSLKQLATIEGSITPGQGPSVIRIAGLERFIVPDSAGYFVVDSLPLGDFELVIESRSNRGDLKVEAETGEVLLDLELGDAKGFAVEDFESFSGVSQTGLILGDGWWYTLDKSQENIKPLWDETLIRSYSGRVGCVSGGCARTSDHLGFLIGLWDTDYNLSSLDTLYFAAKGNGSLNIALAYGEYGENESGLKTTVPLEENWKGYAVAVSDMIPYGSAKEDTILVSRIHFSVSGGGEVFLDDISLGKIDSTFLENAKVEWEKPEASVFPGEDWGEHDALLSQIVGYGLMEFYIGSRFQFAEHWNFFLEYASVGYQYYESLVHLGFQYSRGVFGSEYGIISYRNIDSYANGRSLYDFNMELELKFFRESLFSPFIGFGLLDCIIDEWIPYNYDDEDRGNNNGGTFVLGATLNLTDEIAIDSQFMIYFGDRYINGGYKAFVFSLTYSFD